MCIGHILNFAQVIFLINMGHIFVYGPYSKCVLIILCMVHILDVYPSYFTVDGSYFNEYWLYS